MKLFLVLFAVSSLSFALPQSFVGSVEFDSENRATMERDGETLNACVIPFNESAANVLSQISGSYSNYRIQGIIVEEVADYQLVEDQIGGLYVVHFDCKSVERK